MQYITITDYLLLPLFLFLVFVIAAYCRNKYYPPKHPLRGYFMWGFSVKIFGSILIGLIYHYYYKGGDTFLYWELTQTINSSLQDSFRTWFRIITSFADTYDVDVYPIPLKWKHIIVRQSM